MEKPQRHDYFEPDTFGRSVQDSLGDDFLIRLRMALGGQNLRVPSVNHQLPEEHVLVLAMGRKDAEALVRLFGGETVYVPVAPKELLCRHLVGQGLTNNEIARRLFISERSVRRFLSASGVANPNRRGNPADAGTRLAAAPRLPVALIAAE